MNNNMIRKSVAVLSSALLTGAALVGFAAPAQAAGEVKLEADAGVGYSVPHKTSFGMKASITAGNDSGELQYLHYQIETAGGVEVYYADSSSATSASTSSTLVVSTSETKDVHSYDSHTSGDLAGYAAFYISEASGSDFAATDDTVSVTVTAFIDKDDDNLPDSDEWQSSQVVKWLDNAEYDVVNALTQPVVGDSTLAGTVTSATMNLAQLNEATRFVVDFTENMAGLTGDTDDDNTLTYDAVDNELTYESDGFSSTIAVGGGTASANLELDESTDIDIATSTRAVSATTVNTIDVAVDASTTNTALSTTDVKIRSGSGSFTLDAVVEDSSEDPNAGVTAVLTITEKTVNELNSAASFSIGGESLTNADATKAEKITASAVTATNGSVSWTVNYSGVEKTEEVLLTISVGGVSDLEVDADGADTSIGDTLTVDAEDSTADKVFSTDLVDEASEVLLFAVDQAFSLNYILLDQFGNRYTASGASIEVSDATNTFTGAFVNGVASVSFPGYDDDNKGTKTMTPDVKLTGSNPSVSETAFDVRIGAENAVASVALSGTFPTATSKQALNTKATTATDERQGEATTAPDQEMSATSITVSDANGNGVRSSVTLSGANLLFNKNDEVYTTGSMTLRTNGSGVATVKISSQYAGTHTLTVTAGGVSTTKDLVFDVAAETAGATLTVDAPAYVAEGSTAQVTVKLVDAFGNPVKTSTSTDALSITYSGPGIVFPSTLPVKTDKNGEAKLSVLLGSADTGSGTITASYDQAGDGDFTGTLVGDLDLSASDSFTIGDAPATQKVNAGSFKGYVAVYARGYEGQRLSAKIGADWVIVDPIVNNQGGDLHRTVDFTGAGVDIAVRIYIDRVLVDTINLTTK